MAKTVCKVINNKVCLTTAEMMKVMGVTQQSLSQWGEKGCPKSDRGWWAIEDVLRWRGLVGEGPDNADEKSNWTAIKLEAEAKLKEQKAEEAAFKNNIVKGEYIKKDDVTQELQRFFIVLKKSLIGYSRMVATEISSYVEPLVARRIEKLITELTTNALEQISIDGVYEPSKLKKKKN